MGKYFTKTMTKKHTVDRIVILEHYIFFSHLHFTFALLFFCLFLFFLFWLETIQTAKYKEVYFWVIQMTRKKINNKWTIERHE